MHLNNVFWTSVTYVTNIFTFTSLTGHNDVEQAPLLSSPNVVHYQEPTYPIFKPPGGKPEDNFTCEYPSMIGFWNCSTPENRGCWLTDNHTTYDINTNYEDVKQTPMGVERNYEFDVTDGWINADGMNFTEAKLFDGTYPGPWIQACWGDVRTHLMALMQSLPTHTDNIYRTSRSPSPTA